MFTTPAFLVALAAGAGPVLIHLLNRRRFRTLDWAAMEFLRDAVKRNKRILEIRDLLLLILRTLAILLFVLALAQPYWSSDPQAQASRKLPVHAVVVLDNSLSMAYTELDKSLLGLARERVTEFLRTLPEHSMVSLIPMCRTDEDTGRTGSLGVQDAVEALAQVRVVDRMAHLSDAAVAVKNALKIPGAPRDKYVVFFSDMQRATWSQAAAASLLEGVSPIQVVQIGAAVRGNTSVADFRLRDGVADAESQAVFLATLRHTGPERRAGVRVTLKVDNQVVEERLVDLVPDQTLELMFRHRFTAAGTPREPLQVPVSLELSPDRLPQDDTRTLMVPVVASVPVVFVDQFGRNEQPQQNRFGETLPLRRLLVPRLGELGNQNQLVQIRHRRPDELSRDELKDARLVVIAGVRDLPPAIDRLLYEYVAQGGQLFIAAGGEFDPAAWNTNSWRDGQGVLPLPLKPRLSGKLPTNGRAAEVIPFRLDPRSFTGEFLRLPMPDTTYQELLGSAFFFQAAGVDEASAPPAEKDQRERLQRLKLWLTDSDDPTARQVKDEMGARWAQFANPLLPDPWLLPLDRLYALSQPQVLGRYTTGEPFAVRRDLGPGSILFLSTGVFPQWNNLAVDQSILLLDQAMRAMLARTLPNQNLGPQPVITIPLESRDLGATFTLQTPASRETVPLLVEALGERAYGLRIRNPVERGLYTIRRTAGAGEATSGKDAWALQLAVNGSADESDLTDINQEQLAQRLAPVQVRWVSAGQGVSVENTVRDRHDLWRWPMLLALACLLGEMAFIAFAKSFRRAAA